MWFGVLGPLRVKHRDAVLPVPAARQRTLLAALLVQPGQPVSFDQLADTVWDGRPPPGARATLRNYVKRLRQRLGPEAGARIRTCDPGYLIDVATAESDLLTFARLCTDGRRAVRARSWRAAGDLLAGAEALWRGPALADVRSEQLRERVIPRLEQLRLQAAEGRIQAGLHLGGEEALLPELQALVVAHPWRERFHGQLMLALYRCGRQADALAAYRHAWHALVSEFGVEPGGELQRLHQRMLAADPALMAPPDAGEQAADTSTPAVPADVPPADAPATEVRSAGQRPPRVVPRQLPAGPAVLAGRAGELRTLDHLLARFTGTPASTPASTGTPTSTSAPASTGTRTSTGTPASTGTPTSTGAPASTGTGAATGIVLIGGTAGAGKPKVEN